VSDRILDLTQDEGRLHVDLNRLVLDSSKGRLFAIPASDLAVVLISSRALSVTPAVFLALAEAGVAVVICDRAYRPRVEMLPLESHHLHSERLRIQVEVSKPRKKQLWKQVVQAKIRAQARVLDLLGANGKRLRQMATRVRSGDPDNLEAQASRQYWPLVFKDPSFRRRPKGQGLNLQLNYGYAVVRGIVARAVCGAGLMPSLGLHHHNRYNAFCLVDDLMEPLRPLVDLVVARSHQDAEFEEKLSPETKRHLVRELTGPWPQGSERRTLFDISSRTASSYVHALEDNQEKLVFPELD